ncbi:hypothetical protein ETD83_17485 [Actinomadura soli]|uniref:IclR-ED domain-containing protein n=1 Tax=Actinomadura soli TaxID=2508997 RepID=A0A5C4JBC0_9ACTN|nr:hypothetical protein ETD83_17485 [Actinomadura soli]
MRGAPNPRLGAGSSLVSRREPRNPFSDDPSAAYTPDTFTDPKSQLDEFAAIRDAGCAVNEGQMNVGVRAVAMPVKGPGQGDGGGAVR